MRRKEASAWTLMVCAPFLRLSQAKTLSELVAAALSCQRVNFAQIGRALLGNVKHQIKKCFRFCANPRIETADAMRGVIKKILKKRKKRLLVCLDWTDIKGFQTLMASVVFKGRSIPICWASCKKHVYEGHRSRNAFEESLLLVLRSLIPEQIAVTLLADRGFGRTELARFCQQYHFDYVIRIQPDVHVRCQSYIGKLVDYPVYKGICRLLRTVEYRSHHPVVQNIVIRWVRGLPQKRDECWFLMSNLIAGGAQISNLYGQRMTIEELFRDLKNKRNGWSLRDTRITRADRLDRFLLILAIAYVILCGIGLWVQATYRPSFWQAASKNQCSVFTIARARLDDLKFNWNQCFRCLREAIDAAVAKWG